MTIYSWEDTFTTFGEEEKQLVTIVIKHIISIHVGRYSWHADDKMPYALGIQTNGKSWQRFFATYEEAREEYQRVKMLIDLNRG